MIAVPIFMLSRKPGLLTKMLQLKHNSALRVTISSTTLELVIAIVNNYGYRGGGTGLIFRDSLHVKMVDAGGKDSFEFSEWLVSCLGCSLRLLIVYRPPYSTEHKVTVSVFLREFSDYLESFVLSKEQILIAGDFNIHVDDTRDVDTVTFSLGCS